MRIGIRRPLVFPRFAKRPAEEMPDGLVAGRGVGKDDVLHLGVALKHANCAFEEGLAEGGEDHVRWVVAQHLDHVLVHDLVVHLLEAKKVFLRELCAVAVVGVAQLPRRQPRALRQNRVLGEADRELMRL